MEILNHVGQLEFVYFPKLPHHTFRSKHAKQNFLETVQRTNAQTKCLGLYKESGLITEEILYDYRFVNEVFNPKLGLNKIIGLIPMYRILWHRVMCVAVVMVNILIIISYSSDYSDKYVGESVILGLTPDGTSRLFAFLAFIMFTCNLFLFMTSLCSSLPFILNTY